jgi:mono/diheme cytochrome c family protein
MSAHGPFLTRWQLCITAMMMALPLCAQGADSAAADLIARGAYLAKTADCIACHSTPGGKPFAGGLPMTTPMGKIFTTNITPDPQTGIGRYTEADFFRAVREGVARDGRNLYPAMPYPSYAKVSDDDMRALYAYFMHGVNPVTQANRESDIRWPMNMRWPLKLWNLVFLDRTAYQAKTARDAVWNRGAYLVQGPGHCGACHTPRGPAFNEKALDESGHAFLSGAALEGWFASNLAGDHNTGLGRWSVQDLQAFLKTGANAHATAFGSMTDVINHSTQFMTDADLNAMAVYLKSLPPARGDEGPAYAFNPKTTVALLTRPAANRGATLYTTYCLHCHGADGRGAAPYLAPLAGNPNLLEKDSSSLVNVVLNGSGQLVIDGVPAPYPMPSYRTVLNDQEIADVLTFTRHSWSNNAGPVAVSAVQKMRDAGE